MKHLTPEVLEQAASVAPEGEVAVHLASCAPCREKARDVKGRQRLLMGLTHYTLSAQGFSRVEARLDEAVEMGQTHPPSSWVPWFVFSVAVGACVFALMSSVSAPMRPAPVFNAVHVLEQAAPFATLTVLAADKAQVRHLDSADWRTLHVGDLARAGDALSVESVVLAPASEVTWAVRATGSFSLGGTATVTLGAGQVTAHVESAFEVLASSRRVVAAEALFSVSRVGAEVVVAVAQGQVDVIDTITAERRRIEAPSALRWSDGSSLKDGRDENLPQLLMEAIPARPWVRLDASSLPVGTVISLDGIPLGTAPFVDMVTHGRRRLGITVPGGMKRESWVNLVGVQVYTPRVEQPVVDEGPGLAPESLSAVMAELQRQRPKLAACYEKWLKANPNAQGQVLLEMLVSAQGEVKEASIESGTVSAASAECLVTTVKSLVLPQIGIEATLQVPLVLRAPE